MDHRNYGKPSLPSLYKGDNMTDVIESVKVIWQYMRLNHQLIKSDALLVFGNHDTQVAKRAVELYFNNWAPIIIFTGGLGRVTSATWRKTEAETFANIATTLGVPNEKIYIENRSSNTGENIEFTKRLIQKNNLKINSIIAIHQPYMERRIFAAIKRFCDNIDIVVTSPQLDFGNYCNELRKNGVTQEDVINIIVGDFQRIDVYARKGFQIPQEIPPIVWDAYHKLVVSFGFTKHVIIGSGVC